MNKIDHLSLNWLVLQVNDDAFVRNKHLLEGTVVDLGCGEAQYRVDILDCADRYVGIDWPSGLHGRKNVDVFADLSRTIPLRAGVADAVVSFQVMEHLPEPDFFLAECFRILRPMGHLLLTVPFMWHVHEEPHDYFRYTKYGLQYLLKKNGFSDVHVEENTGFWQMFILKLNYHTYLRSRWPFRLFLIPIWWLGQALAPLLDQLDRHPEETASYTVTARKP